MASIPHVRCARVIFGLLISGVGVMGPVSAASRNPPLTPPVTLPPRSSRTVPNDPFTIPRKDLPSKQRVDEEIKSVLSRKEFQRRGPSFMEQFRNWLLDLLTRLGFRQPDIKLGQNSIDFVQLFVLLLATGGFLFLIYYAVRYGTRRIGAEQIRSARSLADEALQTPDAYLREAEAMAAQGEYRLALEKVYVGTLLHLGLKEAMEFNPRRTNWENLRTLNRAFPAEPSRLLRRVSRLFDRKWYGLEEIGAEEYRRAAEDLAAVRAGVSSMMVKSEVSGKVPAEVPA